MNIKRFFEKTNKNYFSIKPKEIVATSSLKTNVSLEKISSLPKTKYSPKNILF